MMLLGKEPRSLLGKEPSRPKDFIFFPAKYNPRENSSQETESKKKALRMDFHSARALYSAWSQEDYSVNVK